MSYADWTMRVIFLDSEEQSLKAFWCNQYHLVVLEERKLDARSIPDVGNWQEGVNIPV